MDMRYEMWVGVGWGVQKKEMEMEMEGKGRHGNGSWELCVVWFGDHRLSYANSDSMNMDGLGPSRGSSCCGEGPGNGITQHRLS
jgi:hypothetical protein